MGLQQADNAAFQEAIRRQREQRENANGRGPAGSVTSDGIQDTGAPLVKDPKKGDPKVQGNSEGKSGGSTDSTTDSTMLIVGFGSSLCCVILSVVGVVMMSRMRSQ